MEFFSGFIKESIGGYLKNLPLPENVGELMELSSQQWLHLAPFVLMFVLHVYLVYYFVANQLKTPIERCNTIGIDRSCPKVATMVDIEDITTEKVSYCRCWKSKKFPLCDGSHKEHNKATGDNVGPVVLRKKVA